MKIIVGWREFAAALRWAESASSEGGPILWEWSPPENDDQLIDAHFGVAGTDGVSAAISRISVRGRCDSPLQSTTWIMPRILDGLSSLIDRLDDAVATIDLMPATGISIFVRTSKLPSHMVWSATIAVVEEDFPRTQVREVMLHDHGPACAVVDGKVLRDSLRSEMLSSSGKTCIILEGDGLVLPTDGGYITIPGAPSATDEKSSAWVFLNRIRSLLESLPEHENPTVKLSLINSGKPPILALELKNRSARIRCCLPDRAES